MSTPRRDIEAMLLTKLAAIGPANGDDVPAPIWRVSTEQKPITDIPPEFRPHLIVLTEEGDSEWVGLSGVQQTSLRVALLVYLNIRPIDDGQEVCTQYSDAIRHCLAVNRFWGGLALVTTLTGVPTHQLLTIPDAIVTIQAEITYMHMDSEAA